MIRRLRGLNPADPIVVPVAVGSLLALLVLGATLAAPAEVARRADTGRPAREVPVDSSVAVCPEAGSAAPVRTLVSVAVAPAATGGARPGAASLGPLSGGSALASISAEGRGRTVTGRTSPDPLVLRATGTLAPGLAGEQLSRSTVGRHRGLASTPCVPAGNDFWFVGPGSNTGERGRLYLANPGSVPVVVDVDLYGPSGPVAAPSAHGLTIAPGRQEVQLLDAIAPGIARLGIHVTARQGRVSAALRDERIDGLVSRGFDWSAPVPEPAPRTVVTGVPGGDGTRKLRILAPGSDDAIVRLTVLGADGSFVPAGLDVIDVRAGTVGEVDVAKLVNPGGATLQLDSDQPVTATVVTSVGVGGTPPGELAFAGATTPIAPDEPALLPAVPIGPGTTTRLYLAAPDGTATLDLVPLGPNGPGRPVPVVVKAGATLQVDPVSLVGPAAGGIAVVVREASGPVHASAVIRESGAAGLLLTVLPLGPGVQSLRVPALRGVLAPS